MLQVRAPSRPRPYIHAARSEVTRSGLEAILLLLDDVVPLTAPQTSGPLSQLPPGNGTLAASRAAGERGAGRLRASGWAGSRRLSSDLPTQALSLSVSLCRPSGALVSRVRNHASSAAGGVGPRRHLHAHRGHVQGMKFTTISPKSGRLLRGTANREQCPLGSGSFGASSLCCAPNACIDSNASSAVRGQVVTKVSFAVVLLLGGVVSVATTIALNTEDLISDDLLKVRRTFQ